MTELPLILLALGLAALVLSPVFLFEHSSRTAAPARTGGGDQRRRELEEHRDRLLDALRESADDLAARRLTEADYRVLTAKYEREAARVLAELDQLQAAAGRKGQKRQKGQRRGRRGATRAQFGRGLAWTGVVLLFAGLAGVALMMSLRPRGEGAPITGIEVSPFGGGGPMGGGVLGAGDATRLAELEPRIARDSSDLEALVEAGHLYLSQQRLSEAAAVNMRALAIDHGQLEAHAHIAVILWADGRTDMALEVLNQVLALRPGFAEALLYRGMILFATGRDPAGAVAAWEDYLRLAPPGADTARIARMLEAARRRR